MECGCECEHQKIGGQNKVNKGGSNAATRGRCTTWSIYSTLRATNPGLDAIRKAYCVVFLGN